MGYWSSRVSRGDEDTNAWVREPTIVTGSSGWGQPPHASLSIATGSSRWGRGGGRTTWRRHARWWGHDRRLELSRTMWGRGDTHVIILSPTRNSIPFYNLNLANSDFSISSNNESPVK